MAGLFCEAHVLSAEEAAAAAHAASGGTRPLMVASAPHPAWSGEDVEVVAPSDLDADATARVVIVDVASCTTLVEVLRRLDGSRPADELVLAFDDPAAVPRKTGDETAFVADGRPVVWVPAIDDARSDDLRRLLDRLRPAATLPVVPWPAADGRRGDELVVACAPLLEAAGAGSDDVVYASDATPLDLYRSLGALREQHDATLGSPGAARLVLTPRARDAHGLAMALAVYELGAELVSTGDAPAAAPGPVAPRFLWASLRASGSLE